MEWWVIVLLFIYTLACLFLIFVILIQAGDKGGGLSSLGSSSQGLSDALGATGAEKTLNNLTTTAAVIFIVLAIVLSVAISGGAGSDDLGLQSGAQSPVSAPFSEMAPPTPGADALAPTDAPPAEQPVTAPATDAGAMTPATDAAAPAQQPAEAPATPETTPPATE